jgi:PhnB protein
MVSKSTRGARPAQTTQAKRELKPAAKASKPATKVSKPAAKAASKASKPAAKASKASKPAAKASKASKPAAKASKASKPAASKASKPAVKASKPASKPASKASKVSARSAAGQARLRPASIRQRRQPGVPPGYAPVTPHLIVSPCAEAMVFYAKAFGAERMSVLPGPGGLIVHAAMRINGQALMLADEQPPTPGRPEARKTPRAAGATTCGVMLYVADVDAWHDRAVGAGARSVMAPSDMFWGDRYAQVEDPYGHVWAIATYQRAVSEAEMIAAMVIMSEGAAASDDEG